MNTITVNNLGKAYKQYPNRWSRLAEWVIPFSKPRSQLTWVLQDINFVVKPGEAVGVIGLNGAGKSTLLKMITGTTQPTTGKIEVQGRVAALLELGMGFHPDFSGRQNVYMAGQLSGMSVEEISMLMSEIEAFADIGDYIEQPVRVYSSGMQVRLAFSVATAKRPDVLIVDEALSVGDAAFQRKCHRRIKSFVNDGTSLLFVSHDIEGVRKICDSAIYLEKGILRAKGEAKLVCDKYENALFGREDDKQISSNPALGNNNKPPSIDPSLLSSSGLVYGEGGAEIEEVWIEDSTGQTANIIHTGEKFTIKYYVNFHRTINNPVVTVNIKTKEGISIYGTHNKLLGKKLGDITLDTKILVVFSMKCQLNVGTFYLNCGVLSDDLDRFLQRKVDALIFKVINDDQQERYGLVDLNADIFFEKRFNNS